MIDAAILITPHSDASPVTHLLWLIPAVPIVAAGIGALLKQPKRKTAALLAIGSMCVSLFFSLVAFVYEVSGWMSGASDA